VWAPHSGRGARAMPHVGTRNAHPGIERNTCRPRESREVRAPAPRLDNPPERKASSHCPRIVRLLYGLVLNTVARTTAPAPLEL
jgi:hypothetical protein